MCLVYKITDKNSYLSSPLQYESMTEIFSLGSSVYFNIFGSLSKIKNK